MYNLVCKKDELKISSKCKRTPAHSCKNMAFSLLGSGKSRAAVLEELTSHIFFLSFFLISNPVKNVKQSLILLEIKA